MNLPIQEEKERENLNEEPPKKKSMLNCFLKSWHPTPTVGYTVILFLLIGKTNWSFFGK